MTYYTPIESVGQMAAFDARAIEVEPMLFACDAAFAADNGWDLTREFLSRLPDDWQADDLVIDSRSHMLKPGWFPAIPGWHLDEVPRDPVTGQPDLRLISDRAEKHVEHISAVVDAGSFAFTEFLVQREEYHLPEFRPDGHCLSLWQLHDAIIESSSPRLTYSVRSGELVQFGYEHYHRATPAKRDGWRWFIRATRRSARKVQNAIRRQAQVYLADERRGW